VQSSEPLSEIKQKAESRLSRGSKNIQKSRDGNDSKLTKNGYGGDKSVHFSNT
jgi:hypothetical protein